MERQQETRKGCLHMCCHQTQGLFGPYNYFVFNNAKHGLPVEYRSLNLPPSTPHMELSDNDECFAEVTQNWNLCNKITTKTDRFFMQRLVETAKFHKDSLQTRKNKLPCIHEPLCCRPHIWLYFTTNILMKVPFF